MDAMINAAFQHYKPTNSSSGPSREAKAFLKLIEDARQSLYPGCKEFIKLSFIVKMYHLKCLYRVRDKALDAFVKIFKRALPKDSALANSF